MTRRYGRRVVVRLAGSIGVLWGAVTLTFLAIHLTPGNTAQIIAGGGGQSIVSPQVLHEVVRQYGLDRPLWLQYFDYLGRVLQFRLGESYELQIPVTQAIGGQLWATVSLALTGGALSIVLATLSAFLTAGRRHPVARGVTRSSELVLASMPTFWVGIILLTAFSYKLHLFPAIGNQGFKSIVLPSFTLALPIGAVVSQVFRSSLDDVLAEPFILTARTRGVREAVVLLRHAGRHAARSLVTISGYVVGGLLGGAVITETLFSRQGIGRLLLQAVQNKDLPLVMGIVMLSAVAYVVVNIIVDLLYPLIDPRLLENP